MIVRYLFKCTRTWSLQQITVFVRGSDIFFVLIEHVIRTSCNVYNSTFEVKIRFEYSRNYIWLRQ